ncbi:hypothetical protein ACHWQZ_G001020 [Mnemiopsis leidyi]
MALGRDAAEFFEGLANNSNTKGNSKLVGSLLDGSFKANLRSVVLLMANVAFILVGSLAFRRIENNHRYTVEVNNWNISKELEFFMEHYKEKNELNSSYLYRPFSMKEWNNLRELHKKQCYKIDNIKTQRLMWNFWSSLDFCATVLTTIGYGNMAPKTKLGRFFTVVYSLIGIPFMALYLTIFSRGFYRMTSWTMRNFFIFLNKNLRNWQSPNRTAHRVVTNAQFKTASLVFVTVILGAFVLGLSWLLHKTNEYDSFLACSYFYLMTLTTVGTGDISMTEHNAVVLVRVLLVFCVGLTLVSAMFNAVRDLLLENKRNVRGATTRLRTTAFFLGSYQRLRGASRQVKRSLSQAAAPISRSRVGQTLRSSSRRHVALHHNHMVGNAQERRLQAAEPKGPIQSKAAFIEEDLLSITSCGSNCHRRQEINQWVECINCNEGVDHCNDENLTKDVFEAEFDSENSNLSS